MLGEKAPELPVVSGQLFMDVDAIHVCSFCPGTSTTASQVHLQIAVKSNESNVLSMAHAAIKLKQVPPLVLRCHGPGTLDKIIAMLIEHRIYVFGRRDYVADYPVQDSGAQEGKKV